MTGRRMSDFLDVALIQRLAEARYAAGGPSVVIIDAQDSSIIVKAGWDDAISEPHSRESILSGHKYLTNNYRDLDEYRYNCQHGYCHIALPISTDSMLLGTMLLSYRMPETAPQRGRLSKIFGSDVPIPVLDGNILSRYIAQERALADLIAHMVTNVASNQINSGTAETQYRALFDNINIGICRKTADAGRLLQFNKAMPRIFGYDSEEEFMSIPMSHFYYDPADRNTLMGLIKKFGFVKDVELRFRKRDDSQIWCSLTASASYEAGGAIRWLDSAIEDITERKKAEEALRQAHHDLELRVHERTAELAQANEMLLAEIAERKKAEKKLRDLSEKDHLTMINNRRKLFELLKLEVEKAKRYSRPLSLIMFDLDHFKSVNDKYGHNVGDMVLKTTTSIVEGLIRKSDVFARYGGEEFMILIPETTREGAALLAEKIRDHVEKYEYPTVKNITISAGVTELGKKDSGAAFIEKADKALYNAKKSGRNRVMTDAPENISLF